MKKPTRLISMADHLDFFKDLADIRHSFRLFAENLPAEGLLIINSDIENYQEICGELPCRTVTFGHGADSDFCAADLSYDSFGRPSFTLVENGQPGDRIELSVPGEHNVYNALGAIAAARALGISVHGIAQGLRNFTGTAEI